MSFSAVNGNLVLNNGTADLTFQISSTSDRTITFPDITCTAVCQNDTATLNNKTFIDSTTNIADNLDTTKKMQFQASGITTGTTRILTIPDASTIIVGTDVAQTLTNKTLTTPVISTISNTGTLTLPTSTDTLIGRATTDTLTNKTLTDATTTFQDDLDNTKKMRLQLSGLTTATTRTLTVPNADITIVGTDVSQTLTNKALTSNTNNVIARELWIGSGSSSVSTYSATAPSTGQILTAIDATTATWQTPQAYADVFSGADTVGGVDISSGWTDIPLNQEFKKTANMTHTASSAEVVVNRTGTFQIIGYFSAISFSGTNSTATCRLMVDTGSGYIEAPGTIIYVALDTAGKDDKGSSSFCVTADIVSGYKLKLQAQRANGSATIKTIPSSGLSITTIGAQGAPGSTGGSSGQVQYNNAGTFTGASNLSIDNADGNPIVLPTSGNPPSSPSDGVKLFGRLRTGRQMLAQIGPSGIDYSFQPGLWANKVAWFTANGNATTVSVSGFGSTASGTATTRNCTSTNLFTSMRRVGYTSSSTAGSSAGTRHGAQQYWAGNATGLGGYYYVARFGISSTVTVSTQRAFVGLLASTTALGNLDPSANTSIAMLGFGIDSADSAWKFMHGNGSSIVKETLTGTFPARNLSVNMFEARIFCKSNDTTIYYSLEVLGGGSLYEGSISTVIPSSTTFLSPQIWTNNGSTALACAIDIVSQYIESDN